MGRNLLEKVWELHTVRDLPTGDTQLFAGLQLVHEVTSPQAFEALRERGLRVKFPELNYAVVDHVIPTGSTARPFSDPLAEEMLAALEKNCEENGVTLFGPESGKQGVVHVVGPELGLTKPGMVIVCGDSHTATHGALGAVACGIGTSQVRDVLATQSFAARRPKVRRIIVTGKRGPWVTAKDIALHLIRTWGVKGGVGFAYELAGPVVEEMTVEERLTLCNMGIEGGARFAYVNPDQKTFDYLKGKPFAPGEKDFPKAVEYYRQISSDSDASFDDDVELPIDNLEPMVTWGITPAQAVNIGEDTPVPGSFPPSERSQVEQALSFMKLKAGRPLCGTRINTVFIGSCTNGRISDLRLAAEVAKHGRAAPGVRALVVPGSQQVAAQAEKEGLCGIFRKAGFQWRLPGCSMCLAMNQDRLKAGDLCVSTSNRNFKGRQGHPEGRTILASPATASASALAGQIADVREVQI